MRARLLVPLLVALVVPAVASAQQLSINDPTVDELAGTAAFTVALSAASSETVTVDYSTADDTASAGLDYTAIPTTTLTFTPGTLTQPINVTILDDLIYENDGVDETFTVDLSNPTNATIADAQGTGTITENEPAPELSIDSPTVDETAGTAAFTVTLSGASSETVTVDYSTADETASAGLDYTAIANTTLTFMPGTLTQPINVTILDDLIYENDGVDETFTVNLAAPSGTITIGIGSGTGTITENEPVPELSIDSPTVDETAGTAAFTVALSGASSETVTVDYSTADDTASAGLDYTAIATTTLTFTPGTLTQPINVTILDDVIYDNDGVDETFTVNLAAPSGTITIVVGSGVGTITENELAPELSIDSPTVDETAGTAAFTVTLSGASSETVTVDYSTADGSASAGLDYTAITNATLTFTPGTLTQPVNVTILDDLIYDNDGVDETFTVNLAAPSGTITIVVGSGVGTITENEPVPELSIDSPIVDETAGTAAFTVTLSGASSQTVTVDYSTADDTASAGLDYTAIANTTLTFTPGTLTQPVNVTILDDLIYENDGVDETFTVNLAAPSGTITIVVGSGVGTITENEPVPELSIDSPIVDETAGTAAFTVTLSGASSQTVTVDYSTADDTASAGLDYTAIANTTLTFTPGTLTQPVNVTILDDLIYENDGVDETFTVNLAAPSGSITIGIGSGTGTITENETAPPVAVPALSFWGVWALLLALGATARRLR